MSKTKAGALSLNGKNALIELRITSTLFFQKHVSIALKFKSVLGIN